MKKVLKQKYPEDPVKLKMLSEYIDRIDNTKLSVYEILDIATNDDLKNYQVFCKLLDTKQRVRYIPEGEEDSSKKLEAIFDAQYHFLKMAKYFEVPENVNLMLINTSNEIRKTKFPYYFLFLDVSLVVYDRTYYSFFITDFNSYKESMKQYSQSKDLPEKTNILTFYQSDKEDLMYDSFDLYDKDRNKYRNKIREYLINFADFVNSEDVKLMFKQKTEKNIERRIQRGKIPLPSFNKIYVIGYLAKYLSKLENNELKTRYEHRFWVRGHFRRFWDKKKYKKLYSSYEKGELKNFEGRRYNLDDSVLRVWVYPYIKGEGMLIEKGYKLK